jgi:DNA-binding beta-propeller fold protein YncE
MAQPAVAQYPTNLFVSSHFPGGPPGSASNAVMQFSAQTGSPVNVFIQPNSGGLERPHGLIHGDDKWFYVTGHQGSVLRYTDWGEFAGAFVAAGSGNLDLGGGLAFSPVNGNLYVTSYQITSANPLSDAVKIYNGASGAFIGNLDIGTPDNGTNAGPNGLNGPIALMFGPDTNLYVSSFNNSAILRYSGITGAPMPAPGQTGAFFVGTNTLSYNNGGLLEPYGLRWTPDGQYLLVASYQTGDVKRYDTNGVFVDNFAVLPAPGPGTNAYPFDVIFDADGNLLVSDAPNNRILRFDGTTGAFTDTFVPAMSGGLVNPTHMILTSIPEPATHTLLILGVSAPLALRRRRRN